MMDDLEATRFTPINKPIPARVVTMFDPPALTRGRTFPAKGIKFTMADILMNASKNNQIEMPEAINFPKHRGHVVQCATHAKDDQVQGNHDCSPYRASLFHNYCKDGISRRDGKPCEFCGGLPDADTENAAMDNCFH